MYVIKITLLTYNLSVINLSYPLGLFPNWPSSNSFVSLVTCCTVLRPCINCSNIDDTKELRSSCVLLACTKLSPFAAKSCIISIHKHKYIILFKFSIYIVYSHCYLKKKKEKRKLYIYHCPQKEIL